MSLPTEHIRKQSLFSGKKLEKAFREARSWVTCKNTYPLKFLPMYQLYEIYGIYYSKVVDVDITYHLGSARSEVYPQNSQIDLNNWNPFHPFFPCSFRPFDEKHDHKLYQPIWIIQLLSNFIQLGFYFNFTFFILVIST